MVISSVCHGYGSMFLLVLSFWFFLVSVINQIYFFKNIFNNIVKCFGLHSCFSFFCSFPAFPALCREFCPSVYVVVIYTSSWCFPPHVYLLITLSSSCLCILDKLSHVPRGATVPFALVHSKCSLEFGWFLSVWHFSYLDFFVN